MRVALKLHFKLNFKRFVPLRFLYWPVRLGLSNMKFKHVGVFLLLEVVHSKKEK